MSQDLGIPVIPRYPTGIWKTFQENFGNRQLPKCTTKIVKKELVFISIYHSVKVCARSVVAISESPRGMT